LGALLFPKCPWLLPNPAAWPGAGAELSYEAGTTPCKGWYGGGWVDSLQGRRWRGTAMLGWTPVGLGEGWGGLLFMELVYEMI